MTNYKLAYAYKNFTYIKYICHCTDPKHECRHPAGHYLRIEFEAVIKNNFNQRIHICEKTWLKMIKKILNAKRRKFTNGGKPIIWTNELTNTEIL